MRSIRSHLSYANVMVTLLAFIVLTGGTAVALNGSNTVFTDDIADDTRTASGGNPAGGLVAADLRPNSVGSSEVTNRSIISGDLTAAARGARAYGRVAADGTLSRRKNVVTPVTRPFTGTYCITLPAGIDPASAVLVVGPDFAGNRTGGTDVSVVEWESTASDCPAGTLEVLTFVYDGDGTDNVVGMADLPGDAVVPDDEPFTFVVP